MNTFRAGIDIGSTTVKLVLTDADGRLIYGQYRRHQARTQETLGDLLREARKAVGPCELNIRITGSGALNLSKALEIEFVQEVVAVASALKKDYPQTDVAIELGGEDAKIIYFTGGMEERMNGVCAGGTGAFIDQMASLLQTDAEGLNREAEHYQHIYPIAARCGVFAKTDIQPLINEGATKADLAASIFGAVVNQTVSGLARGRPIRGCVAFLGGPLHFLPELKKSFVRTLGLTRENIVDPENAHLYAALGAALGAESGMSLDGLISRLEGGVSVTFEMPRLPALFETHEEYEEFLLRHAQSVVCKENLSEYSGNCYLGIDAGSTTTKVALIGEKGQLLYSFYANNQGNPIQTAKTAIEELKSQLPPNATVVRSCSTGYGEALLKTAFALDDGEVETVAHCTAAKFFDPQVDCVLDIGGQDMKCIKLKDGVVDSIMLNEACSSGCGSFIENFANSLGYSAEDFAAEALKAEHPVDLGTRCTVFMNSNVKQAQKEGVSVPDISAGLAYSVIKNAIYKVIKLLDAKELGSHIVVQGGTFHNGAVLRAFEKITETKVVCPDISGIMGAFGAALLARERYDGSESTMLSLEAISALTYTSKSTRCGGCSNRCLLTVNRFPGGRTHITGNRCEKGGGGEKNATPKESIYAYKRQRIFGYQPLSSEEAVRGEIGIPRVLNMYENYPFWATFFGQLKFKVTLSPFSSREIYELGMESIPSESECYPAKLAHGHMEWLIRQGVKTVFYPCVYFEHQEIPQAQNHYNCPVVISYSENIKNNVEAVTDGQIRYLRPFMALTSEKTAADRLTKFFLREFGIPESETRAAVKTAWAEQLRAKEDIRREGRRLAERARAENAPVIVLAGRPYHIDPEINHGIPELIASYGMYVLSEDSIPLDFTPTRPLRVVDQWVYHTRLYCAAEYVSLHKDAELIQLTSFGCGVDAVTADQVKEILDKSGKMHTLLKIDEVNNLGAVRIRIRSLIAAMKMRNQTPEARKNEDITYHRTHFTKKMRKEGYTILTPQMSPIHFRMMEQAFRKHHYNMVILENDNRAAVDAGLKYVNNDACYPSIVMVGQFMEAILSGKYDTDKLAVIMTQTGGCCRASNYVGLIRHALDKANLSHIPVISVNTNGMETNEGFQPSPGLILDVAHAFVYGDILMRCLYRMRPYETVKGSADALCEKWIQVCIDSIVNPKTKHRYKSVCHAMVREFDALPIDETLRKPRVGIVGEIMVKYSPMANNRLVELLEKEGAEVAVPDFLDFFNYTFFGSQYKAKYLGTKKTSAVVSKIGIGAIEMIRKPAVDAFRASKHFGVPQTIYQTAEHTKPFLSLGNRYGEGWLLTGEMVELIESGVPNIVCIQPFGCLPNHVVGKGVIKVLKKAFPQSNIVAVDYDPGASEVNQLNRIKLMLASAQAETT